jgi:hypothetical protein
MTAPTVADVVSALAFRDNRDPIVLHHRDDEGRWAGTWDLVVDDTKDDTVTATLYDYDSDTALAVVQLQVSVMPCEPPARPARWEGASL